jgi:hypothetical protein
MAYTQYATLAVGLLCVAGRLVAWGPLRFWRRSQLNRFDLCVMTATLLGTAVFNSGTEAATGNLWVAESLTFLRMLRLARVFRFLTGFSSTVLAFWDVVPLLGQYVLILLSSLFAFAVVGEHAFGGLLLRSNPRVAASSYGLYAYYDVVNFDSLPDAMFSVFYVLSVNDWVTLMEGCVAAVGLGARIYFIAFWPINVLFILNVLIAFITVALGAEKERRDFTAAALRAEKRGRSSKAPPKPPGAAALLPPPRGRSTRLRPPLSSASSCVTRLAAPRCRSPRSRRRLPCPRWAPRPARACTWAPA